LGDRPNENFYSNYGNDAERSFDAAERGVAGSRDRAFEENRLAQNLRMRGARNAARSSNVQQAMQQAAMTSTQKGNENITGQYNNALRALLTRRAGFENEQDRVVMGGREQATLRDQQDRDNFFTQLSRSFSNMGLGQQYTGRAQKLRQLAQTPEGASLMDELEQILKSLG